MKRDICDSVTHILQKFAIFEEGCRYIQPTKSLLELSVIYTNIDSPMPYTGLDKSSLNVGFSSVLMYK